MARKLASGKERSHRHKIFITKRIFDFFDSLPQLKQLAADIINSQNEDTAQDGTMYGSTGNEVRFTAMRLGKQMIIICAGNESNEETKCLECLVKKNKWENVLPTIMEITFAPKGY
jgi:hypothetical protein